MNSMTATLKTHPLAVGSDGLTNFLYLEGKVNSQSSADDHESVYNVKFTTTLGFTLTMGYSRYKSGNHPGQPMLGLLLETCVLAVGRKS